MPTEREGDEAGKPRDSRSYDNLKEMPRWRQVVRAIATALVLLAGFEVLACDLVSPACCKLSGSQHDADSDHGNTVDDTCLCCLTHYTNPHYFQPAVLDHVERLTGLASVRAPLPEPSRILHPPRV